MQRAVRPLAVALLLVPGSLAYLYYLNVMLHHRFDYGYVPRRSIIAIITIISVVESRDAIN
jgi:hypothetical protein